MFQFGAITEITPAGSPPLQRHDFVALLDYGVYTLFGQDVTAIRTHQLWAEGGVYLLDFSGTNIAQSFYLDLEAGVYRVLVGNARLYQSSYFYGDPEMIRVPAEVTDMRMLAEPRTMFVRAKSPEPFIEDDPDLALPPRLRRT